MILVFDTETTGRNPRTARLVQLAALAVDPSDYHIHAKINHIIQPEFFEIPVEAAAIHGISTERAWDEGVPLAQALDDFNSFVNEALRAVGHNLSYDQTIMLCEFARMGYDPTHLSGLIPFCTMLSLTDRMRLPGKFAQRGYKWPRLDEAHRFCFDGEEFDNAHDAMADVTATLRIFVHGVVQKWWR